MNRILIVEDDQQLGELVKTYLSSHGFESFHISNPLKAIEDVKNQEYDILILDVMMPGMNGFEFLKEFRKISKVPVLMLTAKAGLEDKVEGLSLGADDYLAKPFEPLELKARVDAILRRTNSTTKNEAKLLFSNGLEIKKDQREALLNNEVLDLTTTEFDLLVVLSENRSKVLSRDDIMNLLMGIDSNIFSRSIDIGISRLRQKLGDNSKDARFIKTIWGKGYMFLGEPVAS